MNTHLITLALLFVMLLAGCTPIQAPEPQQTPAEPKGLYPNAPPYAIRGSLAVGYKSLVIGEGSEQPLQVELWYPALNPKGKKEAITYTLKNKDPQWEPSKPMVVHGRALRDAAPNSGQGMYPLIVLSHGFSISALFYTVMGEHLASHGFIVIAPDHVEQFFPGGNDFWKATIDRPRVIKQTLDYAETLAASGGEMAGILDMQHVAVMGHSYGGYTSLAMAGAQFDLAGYHALCNELPVEARGSVLCDDLIPKEAEMATRAGLTSIPEGLWPAMGDPRVTAIIPMAGDAYLFGKVGLGKVTVPMMAIGGTADTATPYLYGAKLAYEHVSSTQKAMVSFIGAEHFIYSDPCDMQSWIKEIPVYEWICFDPVWNHRRALDLLLHFSTAFLLDTLKGDRDAHQALLPDAVNFPGIEYTTTMQ